MGLSLKARGCFVNPGQFLESSSKLHWLGFVSVRQLALSDLTRCNISSLLDAYLLYSQTTIFNGQSDIFLCHSNVHFFSRWHPICDTHICCERQGGKELS